MFLLSFVAASLSGGGQSSGRGLWAAPFDPRISPHEYAAPKRKVGVIVVDHGSKRAASNERLEKLCEVYRERVRGRWVVKAAHMELASPTVEDAFASCVAEGCEIVVVHPFFLGPGKHASEDIPKLVQAANDKFPQVKAVVTDPLGADPLILDILHASVKDAVTREDASSGTKKDPFENSFFGSVQAAMERAQAKRRTTTPTPDHQPNDDDAE